MWRDVYRAYSFQYQGIEPGNILIYGLIVEAASSYSRTWEESAGAKKIWEAGDYGVAKTSGLI